MKQSTLLLIPFLFVIVSVSVRADDTRRLSIASRQTILEKHDVQLHFPFLHEAKNGAWYMTYREGRHTSKGETVYCIMSSDHGKSWKTWSGLKAEPQLRFFRLQLRGGTLLSHRYTMEETRPGEGTLFLLRSHDDGATWTKHAARATGLPFDHPPSLHEPVLWGHIVQMPDDRLLCGIYGIRSRKQMAGVIESTDNGSTWQYLAHLYDDFSPNSGNANEIDLVRLASGDLIAVMRNDSGPMRQVRSHDGGKNWTSPSDLDTFGVSPQLLLLENGVLVCTYGTRDVYAMASWDGTGREWSKPMLVYKGQGSGYTDLQTLSADTFRMVFDQSPFHNRKPGGKIVRVVVSAKK